MNGALAIVVVWLGYFLVNINITLIIPLISFMQQDINLSDREAGALLASFPVVALVSNIAIGPFIDRYGRKRFIIAGAIGCAVTLLLTAMAENGIMVSLGRASTGLFMPMIGSSIFAAVADYFPKTARTRVTGYVMSASPVAFLISMPLGVMLGASVGWRVPILALSALSISIAICASMLPATDHNEISNVSITATTYIDRLLSFSLSRDTRALLLSYFCFSAAALIFLGLYPTWVIADGLAGVGTRAVGTLLFLGGLGGLSGALLSGWLAKFFRHPLELCAVAAFATGIATRNRGKTPGKHGTKVDQSRFYGR